MVVKDGGKSQKDWKSFVKTAEELCRRTLIRDVDKKKGSPLLKEQGHAQSIAEEERKKRRMRKERSRGFGIPHGETKREYRFWVTQNLIVH